MLNETPLYCTCAVHRGGLPKQWMHERVHSYRPHFGLPRDFRSIAGHRPVAVSVGTPLCPYGIAYRKSYGLSTSGLFKNSVVPPGARVPILQNQADCVVGGYEARH